MRNQKEQKASREAFMATIANVDFDGFEMLGVTKEGTLFGDADGNFNTVKIVAHKDGFDADTALKEKADAVAKAEKAEAEKLAKQAEREAKKVEKAKTE